MIILTKEYIKNPINEIDEKLKQLSYEKLPQLVRTLIHEAQVAQEFILEKRQLSSSNGFFQYIFFYIELFYRCNFSKL